MGQATTQLRATFRDVLAIREFRVLYVCQALSVLGDQFARIAIATIVYDRTNSSWATGASYALSYLPSMAGGLLSVAADRFPRRTVMIICDSARGLIVTIAAFPRLPVLVLLVAVTAVGLLQPLFSAARAGLVPEVVGEGASYTAASTLGNATNQMGVVLGFGLGGVLVGGLGAPRTILLDAGTFILSALAIARFVSPRPSAYRGNGSRSDLRSGASVVFGDSNLRWLVTTSWVVVTTAIATEGIAVPYAHAHGQTALAAGALTGALPAGTAVGALGLGRLMSAEHAARTIRPLALGTPMILFLTALNPGIAVASFLWFVAGVASASTVIANRVFVVAVPASMRSRAFGLAAASITMGQGVGTLLVGALARVISPSAAVAAVSLLAFVALLLMGRPAPQPPHWPVHDLGLRRHSAQPQ